MDTIFFIFFFLDIHTYYIRKCYAYILDAWESVLSCKIAERTVVGFLESKDWDLRCHTIKKQDIQFLNAARLRKQKNIPLPRDTKIKFKPDKKTNKKQNKRKHKKQTKTGIFTGKLSWIKYFEIINNISTF